MVLECLHQTGLPLYLWDEAACHIVCLPAKCPALTTSQNHPKRHMGREPHFRPRDSFWSNDLLSGTPPGHFKGFPMAKRASVFSTSECKMRFQLATSPSIRPNPFQKRHFRAITTPELLCNKQIQDWTTEVWHWTTTTSHNKLISATSHTIIYNTRRPSCTQLLLPRRVCGRILWV